MQVDRNIEREKVNEKFFNELISLKLSEKEAMEISSTFLFSWMKKNGISKEFDILKYSQDIETFLQELKKRLSK